VIVGVDFGAPRHARDQRRKNIAIAAQATGWRAYRIDATGMNAQLLANDPPGWSTQELVDELLTRPPRVVGFDFPFCVPHALLRDPRFASDVGYKDGAFIGWRSFNWWIAQRLPLTDPVDFTPFGPCRDRAERARLWTKSATDIAAGGQPPLKDKFQATFQMTLLGNTLLSKLWESHKYRVLPFPGGRGDGEVIEIYQAPRCARWGSPATSRGPTKRCASASPRVPPRASSSKSISGSSPSRAGRARAPRRHPTTTWPMRSSPSARRSSTPRAGAVRSSRPTRSALEGVGGGDLGTGHCSVRRTEFRCGRRPGRMTRLRVVLPGGRWTTATTAPDTDGGGARERHWHTTRSTGCKSALAFGHRSRAS
jgi:hypothetical protein